MESVIEYMEKLGIDMDGMHWSIEGYWICNSHEHRYMHGSGSIVLVYRKLVVVPATAPLFKSISQRIRKGRGTGCKQDVRSSFVRGTVNLSCTHQ
ncbi:hypothetical protein C7R94_12355 [Brevibacillus sp. NRRL NRS-603]|nr:hypothetical protein [Brevibacillus formosus]PSK17967.1 hypothetical protein C7R94_12355 [Brevibacillus sp. NRRL NRS-603]